MKAMLKGEMAAMIVFLFFATAYAENPALVRLEDKIVLEMETLIDNTGLIPEEDQKECEKLIQKGIEEHDKGKFEKAIEYYEKALEKNPLSGLAYYEIGYSLNSIGNQVKALEAVLRSIALDPKSEMAYVMKANILDNLGLPDDAIDAYGRILEIKPDSVYARLNLGITLLRQGDYDRAWSEFMQTREVAPEHPSPPFYLAIIARNRGENYEEERFLNEFVRVGENDRRLPEVEKRLKDMKTVSININIFNTENAAIEMAEGGARALWRTEKHREAFPEAKGYFPSYEEEIDVLGTALSIWKEMKEKDGSIAHSVYDFAHSAEKAGHLETYVWYANREKLGRRAEDWIEENDQKVNAFVDWAGSAGFSEQIEAMNPSAAVGRKSSIGVRDLPAIVMNAAEESNFVYEIGGESTPKDVEKFLNQEGKRFKNLFKNDAYRCVDKKDAREALEAMGDLVAPHPYQTVIRVFFPGEKEWDAAIRMCSGMGRRYRDLTLPAAVAGHVEKKGDRIFVRTADTRWFPYYLAKAVWRYEPGFRQRFGGEDEDGASLDEEEFALAVMIGGHRNMKDSGDVEPDPYMDTVDAVFESGVLPGFVMMEILHKTYGVSLECLPSGLEEQLRNYFFNFSLERMKAEDLARDFVR